MVGHLSIYGDIFLSVELEVREWFQFRADKLQRRTKFVASQKLKEEFGKGRPLRLREHTFLLEEPGLEGARTLCYYDKSRVDGLERRELSRFQMTEHFKGRDDFLLKREVSDVLVMTELKGKFNPRAFPY